MSFGPFTQLLVWFQLGLSPPSAELMQHPLDTAGLSSHFISLSSCASDLALARGLKATQGTVVSLLEMICSVHLVFLFYLCSGDFQVMCCIAAPSRLGALMVLFCDVDNSY